MLARARAPLRKLMASSSPSKQALVVLVPPEFGGAVVTSFLDCDDADSDDGNEPVAHHGFQHFAFLSDTLQRERGFASQLISLSRLCEFSKADFIVLVTKSAASAVPQSGPACLVAGAHVVRRAFPAAFVCVWHASATEDAPFRQVACTAVEV